MTSCSRCEWRADRTSEVPPAEQLSEHAADAGHPLCGACARSLPDGEGAACDRCLQNARSLLRAVVDLWEALPAHLAALRGSALDRGTPAASDGRPLPGGDALVLLAGGSSGLSDDGTTAKVTDPPSVSYELGWWAAEWYTARMGEAWLAGRRMTVPEAASYLERRARWAATSHPGFGTYLADLRALHARLESVCQVRRHARRLPATCFDCSQPLYAEVDEDGLEQPWASCRTRGCGREYTAAEFHLALRAQLEAERDRQQEADKMKQALGMEDTS